MTCILQQAADRFGIERLKRMCEHSMLASISIENAPSVLLAADLYNVRTAVWHVMRALVYDVLAACCIGAIAPRYFTNPPYV